MAYVLLRIFLFARSTNPLRIPRMKGSLFNNTGVSWGFRNSWASWEWSRKPLSGAFLFPTMLLFLGQVFVLTRGLGVCTEPCMGVASPTRWTGVWAGPGSWRWTGKPGMLQSMGLQSQTRLNGLPEPRGILTPALTLWFDMSKYPDWECCPLLLYILESKKLTSLTQFLGWFPCVWFCHFWFSELWPGKGKRSCDAKHPKQTETRLPGPPSLSEN